MESRASAGHKRGATAGQDVFSAGSQESRQVAESRNGADSISHWFGEVLRAYDRAHADRPRTGIVLAHPVAYEECSLGWDTESVQCRLIDLWSRLAPAHLA